MSTYQSRRGVEQDDRDLHRANPMGAYITTLGAVITLISVWLNWISLGEGESEATSAMGYETDGLIPYMAYLGIAFAFALLYATTKADRRQHRGLSLASMAVGLASLLWAVSFLINPIATVELGENVTTEIGVYIAILGTAIWTIGSYLLAKEPEGDFERPRVIERDRTDDRHGIETHGTDAPRHTTTDTADADHRDTRRDQGRSGGTGL